MCVACNDDDDKDEREGVQQQPQRALEPNLDHAARIKVGFRIRLRIFRIRLEITRIRLEITRIRLEIIRIRLEIFGIRLERIRF